MYNLRHSEVHSWFSEQDFGTFSLSEIANISWNLVIQEADNHNYKFEHVLKQLFKEEK